MQGEIEKEFIVKRKTISCDYIPFCNIYIAGRWLTKKPLWLPRKPFKKFETENGDLFFECEN